MYKNNLIISQLSLKSRRAFTCVRQTNKDLHYHLITSLGRLWINEMNSLIRVRGRIVTRIFQTATWWQVNIVICMALFWTLFFRGCRIFRSLRSSFFNFSIHSHAFSFARRRFIVEYDGGFGSAKFRKGSQRVKFIDSTYP